ncbi:MAG: AraC family transcriptional regulator [Clostridiales bacterium]|nr:AraC family transcriptional regulator [Clostridiales bacterium]
MQHERLRFSAYVRAGEEIRILVDEIQGRHPAHSHDDFIEAAYIDAGSGVHILNGREERISEGDLFLFDPHIVHAFIADGDRPLRVYNCLFQPPTLDPSFKDCKDFVDVAYHYLFYSLSADDDPKGYIRLTGASAAEIRSLFYEIRREYESRENGYEQMLKANLMKLMIYIFRLYKKDEAQRQNPSVYNRLVVQEAASYIRQHFDEEIPCGKLADRAFLSVNYFRKIFKEITGMTMIRMQQNVRVHTACDLLVNTRLSVSDIAARVGYGDLKFFYQVFRRVQGRHPRRLSEKPQRCITP